MRSEQGRDMGLGVRFRPGHGSGPEQRAGVALRQERGRDPRFDISAKLEMDLGRGPLPRSGSSSDSDMGLGRGMALGQVVERDLEEEEEDEAQKPTVMPGINLWQGQWLGQRSGLEVDDKLRSSVATGAGVQQDNSPREGLSLELGHRNDRGQNIEAELNQRRIQDERIEPQLSHNNVQGQRREPEGQRTREGGTNSSFGVNGDLTSCSFQQLMFAEETDL